MEHILKFWGLSNEVVTLLHAGEDNSTWSVGDKYILQHKPNSAQHSIQLANLLMENGIPAAVYVKTISGDWTTPDGTHCLMEKVEGLHVDFYESPELIRELGRGLALLHAAFLKLEPRLHCKDNNFIGEWNSWIKPGLSGVSDSLVQRTEEQLFGLYEKLPRCPIHRDVHAQNVLFNNGKISGWLDFDLNRKDARIFDLAYLLAGLLVGKIDNPPMIEIWRTLYRDVLAGYNEISALTAAEIEALPVLMVAIELLFVTFWSSKGNTKGRAEALALAEWINKFPNSAFLQTATDWEGIRNGGNTEFSGNATLQKLRKLGF
jgi:Ser/Thr protein kinase RdoA (MazF antagonist)